MGIVKDSESVLATKCSDLPIVRVQLIEKLIRWRENLQRNFNTYNIVRYHTLVKGKGKGKVHPCTGTEALYRQYGPWGE